MDSHVHRRLRVESGSELEVSNSVRPNQLDMFASTVSSRLLDWLDLHLSWSYFTDLCKCFSCVSFGPLGIGWLILPTKCPCPNPRTCEYLIWHGTGTLQMWLSKGSWDGEVTLDHLGGWNRLTRVPVIGSRRVFIRESNITGEAEEGEMWRW